MTLTEFKKSFPDIYKLYEANSYSGNKDLKPIDRMVNFIESKYDIALINIVLEEGDRYRPCIRINSEKKIYDCLLPLYQSKSLLVSKALEYLHTGTIY